MLRLDGINVKNGTWTFRWIMSVPLPPGFEGPIQQVQLVSTDAMPRVNINN